jgi:hypothetical protein
MEVVDNGRNKITEIKKPTFKKKGLSLSVG